MEKFLFLAYYSMKLRFFQYVNYVFAKRRFKNNVKIRKNILTNQMPCGIIIRTEYWGVAKR